MSSQEKTIETNQLTNVSVNNGSMAYIDQMISLRIFKTIEKLTGKMDIKSIIFLIGLIGADTFKNAIKKMIESSVSKITGVDFYKVFYRLFQSKQKEILDVTKEEKNTLTLQYKPKDIFWSNIDKYSGFSYTCMSNEIEQTSKNEYILYKNVSNVVIKHTDFECSIPNTLKLKYICTGNEQKLENSSREKFKFDTTKDLIKQIPFPEFVKDYYFNNYHGGNLYSSSSVYFMEFRAKLFNIFRVYNDETLLEIHIKVILFAGRKSNTMLKFSKGTQLFGIDVREEFTLCLDRVIPIKHADKVKEWVDANVLNQTSSNSSANSSLSLNLKSEDKNIDLLSAWTNFVDDLQKDSVDPTASKNIKLYDLKITETEEIVDIPNPEYNEAPEEDQQAKEETDKSKTKQKKTIKKVITKKSIEETLINELYKDFSTLYLKEKDQFVLKNTLSRFKYNKDIYKNLGLPYKFGALLYGEPGTGKSSAINAIASFLQKDIYYMDLTNVKTNDDLKLLFNRVNKEKSNNGIIVIEDIDAMTDVVHTRTEETKNKALTLECFLNLLQGTLTQDGTTFLITTNHLEKLDPAFYRDGRFDIKVNLTSCDHYQMNTIYKRFFSKEIPNDLLSKIEEEKTTPASFIQELLPYILKPETEDIEILKNLIKN